MRGRDRRRRVGPPAVGVAAQLVLALATGGCGGRPATPPVADHPPVVLVTANGLRADFVESLGGMPGLTPHFDRFLAQADLAGRAVAASTDPTAAALSLLTGLLPSQHGALGGEERRLGAGRETLAQALASEGYQTAAYVGGHWAEPGLGHAAGFDEWYRLGAGREAVARLRELPDEPIFVWVDLDVPAPPLRRYPALEPRLSGLGLLPATGDLPDRVGAGELAAALEGRGPIADSERGRLLALYCLNVARADMRIGELIEALDASPAAERAVVVVVSARGEPIGDHGAGERSGSLRRRWLEVPLGIRLGRAALAAPADLPAPSSVASVNATILETVAIAPLPAQAPSLRRASPAALSELWEGDELELSMVAAASNKELTQVVWRGRAAALPDPAAGELAGFTWGAGREEPLSGPAASRLFDGMMRQRRLVAGELPEPPRPLEREAAPRAK